MTLRSELQRIDGCSWPAYKDLIGRWDLDEISLWVEHVQGDPYAAPSRLRLRVQTGIPSEICTDPAQRLAAEDWLLRRFAEGLTSERLGSGRSGLINVYHPGPEIWERSACRLAADGSVDVRLVVGLPGRGRRIAGRAAELLLLDRLPEQARRLIVGADPALIEQVQSVLLQRCLRDQLNAQGLIAFIANGSVLPRATGVSTAPLQGALPFCSPPSLAVTLKTPWGSVRGMGIPTGVTVIVGGGFHGKSTLLSALQWGFLDHIPGDGREQVVSVFDTVKVRAEDGRPVSEVDISAFLDGLPGGQDTHAFHTDNASGSTSQAAAIVEAIEAGARVLLIDEDTSATNLLVRDTVMHQLVPDEPITPFVDRVQQLAAQGVSTVIVVGGVSAYLSVADQVIGMVHWAPVDLTERARTLCPPIPCTGAMAPPHPRIPRTTPWATERVRARDTRSVQVGDTEIDLTAVEQVLDAAHASTLGHALVFLGSIIDGHRTIPQLLNAIDAILNDEGVEVLSPWPSPSGDLIRPRRHEIASALNRHRKLSMKNADIR